MRARDMHPLCCITSDCPGFGLGGRSPCESDEVPAAAPPHLDGDRPQTTSVAGILYKWTNFGKGWRPRWFVLRDGVLTYCKIRQPDVVAPPMESEGMRLIGISGGSRSAGERLKVVGAVHLKISSFRESKSDDKRFYIIAPGKTLQLRTDSAKARVAWIEALVAARSESFLNGSCDINPNDMFFSTERLRSRMRAEGLGEAFIRDCEKIIQAEFSQHFAQMKARYEDYLSFLGTFPQQMESFNLEGRTTRIDEDRLLLRKHEFSSSGHGKFSEYSNTESSEDIDQKQEVDELLEEDNLCYFDSRQSFSDCAFTTSSPKVRNDNRGDLLPSLQTKRRTKLPDPIEKEKGISLWSIIKDNVGKDLTRVCLPVYFNEPLSSLQKCFEDLEYSFLLDRAYEYGKMGNSPMRILNVAAFAVSAYASSDGRLCKPFNPLLGETYEAEFPEKGLRFFSEKVSHHPMVMACHCEGRGWKFWGDSELQNKFWGQSIQLDPVGKLTLEFDDGETFQWSKVTTTIHNLIIGKVFCNHHGTMSISGNQQYSCTLKFKEHSFLDRNPRQVEGFVKDNISGAKAATLTGRWDDSMYSTVNDDASISNSCASSQQNTLLWKKNESSENPTRYNLTSFAITLNEITPGLKEKLPPTDSRLRPDQRYLENGEYEKANVEKLRLERRQRMSRKWQENGWQPRWFRKTSEAATFGYVGGYWEARAQRKWDGCPDIFGDLSYDSNNASSENNSKS